MAKSREPVLVIGLGRFGLTLARELHDIGTPVLAVDSDMDRVQHASYTVPNVMQANCTDVDALRGLGAADFTRAVVAIGSNMEASILTTSLLADLGIEEIWAKANTTQHARILTRIGAHRVVQPEYEMGERVAHLVSQRVVDYVEASPGWILATVHPPQSLVGESLDVVQVLTRRAVSVVAVRPQGADRFRHINADTVLAYGDDIMVMGAPDDVERFVED